MLFPRLETVHLELVRLRQARLGQPLANVFPLVALQLQNLTVLGVLDHSAIARKFLQGKNNYNYNRSQPSILNPNSPSYMLARSSSDRTPPTDPARWLVFCDHSSAGFLCARVRLVHHHQHPLLHPQMGLCVGKKKRRTKIKFSLICNKLREHPSLRLPHSRESLVCLLGKVRFNKHKQE